MVAVRVSPAMVNAAFKFTSAANGSFSGKQPFRQGDIVVYPTHGVGTIDRVGSEQISGHWLHLIHITFEDTQMTLSVPVTKARQTGLRKLATSLQLEEALTVLQGPARISRTMWRKYAEVYTAKINSGDLIAVSEVVRDLWTDDATIVSHSHREYSELATDRLAAEFAAVKRVSKQDAFVQRGRILQNAAATRAGKNKS